MPPWSADPNHGEWANDPRLSQKEIDTVIDGLLEDVKPPKSEIKL